MLIDIGCNRNLTKTLDYLEVFARFKDEENIKAVERLLNSHTELESFERSQLGELSLFLRVNGSMCGMWLMWFDSRELVLR